MTEKSFEQILRDKLGESNAQKVPPAPPKFDADRHEHWWTEMHLRPNRFSHFGKLRYQSVAEETQEAVEEHDTSDQEADEPCPAQQPPRWNFHQQLALDQMIRLGAPLRLNSSFEEIKRAYRQLVKSFHPDRHQEKSIGEQQQLSEKLQLVVETFQILESSQ